MDSKVFWRITLLVIISGILFSGCKPSNFEETDCQFEVPAGEEIECGYLTVPEDRNIEESPTIRLHVAIVHAQNSDPAPDPLVFLHGGPGGYALDMMDVWLSLFGQVRRYRDLIIFDQRGVGYSRPSLNCPEVENQWYQDWTKDISAAEADNNYIQALQTCHERLVAEGINLAAYTSAANAADIEELRKALGYSELNLYGSSYGTRLALTVMRDYPDGVRSVILDSVYPPESNLFVSLTSNFERSLNLVFEGCEVEPECLQAYPDLRTTYYELIAKLDEEPLEIGLTRPSTGQTYSVIINGDRYIWATFQMLYLANQIPLLPWQIYSITNGSTPGSYPGLFQQFIFFDDFWSEAMYYSIQCNEEMPFTIPEIMANANETVPPRLLAAIDNMQFFQACQAWGSPQPASIENEAVVSDIPTLILSGEFDPITPPAWGQMVAENLSNSQFLEFPGFSHGILGSGSDGGYCSSKIVLAFLSDPNTQVDANCIKNFTIDFSD